ncbi:LysR family transcriptional regulator [Paenibacillus sp. 7124]|uniref:LysR family transcriptional regulator n=1 Tax=Paenibacillus apii TaxID=1850370 RepID=A0A6M1PXY0_9BACL|nr:LysR family transcriptional regulator [Paenibacillus apii]NGM85051.1 LysR family transcriptional regulator [Paenibacillus apii]
MELTYLRTFCEVIKSGSYTRAAEQLGYAQSSVTAQIAKLEEMYGAKLLERSGHGMAPTFAGKTLLGYARQMLALSEEAKAIISEGQAGELTVGCIETLAAYFLPDRLHRFRKQYPDIRLRVLPGSESDIIAGVRNKSSDFGLIFDKPYVSEDLQVLPLRQEELFIIVHPGHPLADFKSVQISLLAAEPLVLTEDTCTYRNHLLQEMRGLGIAPRVELEFGNLEGIKQAVKHEWGIAFLPGYTVLEELEREELKAIPVAEGGGWGFQIQLIYRKDRWLSASFERFIEMMRGADDVKIEGSARQE